MNVTRNLQSEMAALAQLLWVKRAAVFLFFIALAGRFSPSWAQTPPPTLASLTPNSAVAGAPGLTLTVNGANFNRLSIIRWNGADRATDFVATTQLTTVIPASDLATAGTATVTVVQATPLGVISSNPLPFTITASAPPVPALVSINPNTANAGNPTFVLTVTGTNFVNTSVVRWNGTDRLTTFVSSRQLTAQVSASDIANPGSAGVTVLTPPNTAGVGGGTSNALPFTINQAPNPIPTINSLNPNPAMAGAQAFALMVAGTNFVAGSVVQLNGTNRPTRFVSATQLSAQISASDIAAAGSASLQVINPVPGGGISNSLQLNIVNPQPAVTALFPNSIVVGSQGSALTINGNGFVSGSSMRWNGANRQTTFVSATQLTVQIPAADVQSVGSAAISVANPSPGGGISNAVTFTVTPQPLPPPSLSNIAATVVAQGTRQVRLTLTGANFRPGARIIIGASQSNAAMMPAADIIVESVNRLNDTTMQALVSVSPQASLETRSVDVVNSDNSSTGLRGTNTTKPLRVQAGSSLGAPLQVVSLMITHPRTGSVISQGDSVFAEAALSGAGTGTVIGQWLWDGNVYEQFVLNLAGGERQPLKTSRPLPTVFIGSHTLELKIISPNLIQSPAVTVVINPGTWKQLRLLAPNSGRGYTPELPPTLRWAIVPGVQKYQVGFSAQPFFRNITQWHDVAGTSWQVPAQVWSALAEGELFWTVRAVEMSGATRQPALMRRIQRVASGALNPIPVAADASGVAGVSIPTLLLQWKELKAPLAAQNNPTVSPVPLAANSPTLYRATISRDPEGRVILRRFLTNSAKVDLRSISRQLTAGETYHWQIEAFTANGRLILIGGRNRFTASAAQKVGEMNWPLMRQPIRPVPSHSADEQKVSQLANRRYPDIASLSLPPIGDAEAEPQPEESQLDAQIIRRTPASGQTVGEARPLVSAELKNKLVSSETYLLIDDTDVTAVAQVIENKIGHKPSIPLNNGAHQVTLNIGGQTAGWSFNVLAATPPTDSTAATPGTDAETESAPTAEASATTDAQANPADPNAATTDATPNQFNTEVTSNTQSVSRQEEEKNDLSISAQGTYTNGPWKTEMNATGLINSIIGPNPRHLLGRWNDYVMRFSRDFGPTTQATAAQTATGQSATAQPASEPKWGFDLSFGMIAPQMHVNAEYINTGFAREGVEAGLRTPLGRFGFYRNTNDKGQGEGIGFGYHQQVNSASYEIPALNIFADPERMKFRLMWLSARDVGGTPLRIGLDENGQPMTTADVFATPRTGDSFGGLLTIKLSQNWLWNSEYALTSNNVNRLLPQSSLNAGRQFGRAWRTGVSGTWHKANISLAFRDVSPNFAIPATANLTQLSLSDRRGLDFSISRDTLYGNFSGTYQLLQSDFRYSDRSHLVLHNVGLNWAKTFGQTTSVTFGVSEARTLTTNRSGQGLPNLPGEAAQRRFGVNGSVNQTISTEKLGSLNLGITGSRNWFRDRVNQNANNIISSAAINAGWNPKPFFQLQSNFSVNWTAGEKFTVGNSVITTAYIQPAFIWARTGWSVMPLLSINHLKSRLGSGITTSDMLMTQTGGRISYQLPGKLRFNTFSFEGSVARTRDGLAGQPTQMTAHMTPRFLFLWTMVRPSKPAPEPVQPANTQ